MPSHLNAVAKTTKISKALQANQGNPTDVADPLLSEFSTVRAVGQPLHAYTQDGTMRLGQLKLSDNGWQVNVLDT